jgi:hypothetical protein
MSTEDTYEPIVNMLGRQQDFRVFERTLHLMSPEVSVTVELLVQAMHREGDGAPYYRHMA